LNPQTWAVLANIFDEERLNNLMDIVEEKLSCDYGYVQCSPSYEKGCDKIGRVSYFQKGLIENGGV
jgi:cellobiose phosphorylase